jgi:hypothetical protein
MDAQHVAAMGHSAGGNLVGMLATTADEAGFDPPDLEPELAAHDPSIVAAVALNPVFDIARFSTTPTWSDAVIEYTGCTRNCLRVQADASVQTMSTAPPRRCWRCSATWIRGRRRSTARWPPTRTRPPASAIGTSRSWSPTATRSSASTRSTSPFTDRFVEFLDRYRG